MSQTPPAAEKTNLFGLIRALGPAIIVASVTLGPGSIVSSSTVGWKHGYRMTWVLVLAGVMMWAMTATAAWVGVSLQGTTGQELRRRMGRWFAALVGVSLFLVASCFQFGNNLGVIYALEPFMPKWNPTWDRLWAPGVLVAVNLGIIAVLFLSRRLYRPVELLMKVLVGVMLVAFAINLAVARPDLVQAARGLVPSLPQAQGEQTVGAYLVLLALVGTTFSVGGAFYQTYLVRQKGWRYEHLRQGMFDSAVGIAVLALLTMMILVTAAAVLHDNPQVKEFRTAGDLARQLQPFFGTWATGIFCTGLFAGAFSSFLVNAMIGGHVLADGLWPGAGLDDTRTKLCTSLALLTGMAVAVGMRLLNLNIGHLIIFAQALTTLVTPVLALTVVCLAFALQRETGRRLPRTLAVLSTLGFLLTLLLAARTAWNVYGKIAG